MKIIGLVGGVASGKSAVARRLSEQGAVVLDADQLAHEVLGYPEVVVLLTKRWGTDILSDGEVDRQKIAKRVFGNSDEEAVERKFLESVLHPRIRRLVEAELNSASQRKVPAAVIDAPLLIEAGWGDMCDLVVYVDAPAELRAERAVARGWDAEEIARREAAQLPIEQKRAVASHTLLNDGSLERLEKRVQGFWQKQIVSS